MVLGIVIFATIFEAIAVSLGLGFVLRLGSFVVGASLFIVASNLNTKTAHPYPDWILAIVFYVSSVIISMLIYYGLNGFPTAQDVVKRVIGLLLFSLAMYFLLK